ncbi:MAG: ApbE family lipoprotein [Subtercola sp.]|nr:ApbE family lipoprotein [Subtercola sp.]
MLIDTFETMGTVASVRLRGSDKAAALEPVQQVFRRYDETFSLYKPMSELSRIASGQMALTDATEAVRMAYAECVRWRAATRGDFTPHRPDGLIDLSGIVKAQAMNEAATLLRGSSAEGWLLDVGGDVVGSTAGTAIGPAASSARHPELWNIGIVDPDDRTRLLCSLPLGDSWSAVATSGTAERGEHVWRTDDSAFFVQVTVLAADIVTADVLATAILSGGRSRLDEATSTFTIDVIAVDRAGGILTTPRVRDVITVTAA